MKKITIFLSFLIIATSFAWSQPYKVDTEKSTVSWLAKKVTGQHNGTVKIKAGELAFSKGVLKKGSFVIDMNTIVNEDLKDADYNAKLIGHLKSEDFFSVEKFPEATFIISSVTARGKVTYIIKGNLTIKGITQPIEFPATVQIIKGIVTGVANIKIDRTKFNIRYGSKKFFESIGDKAINDEFELTIKLVANKSN
jgi:polyisoprenoid-binding protein YceI